VETNVFLWLSDFIHYFKSFMNPPHIRDVAHVVQRSFSMWRGTEIDTLLLQFLFSRLNLVKKSPFWLGIEPWSPA